VEGIDIYRIVRHAIENRLSSSLFERRIKIGQGEYILFHRRADQRESLSEKVFETAYAALLQYSPAVLEKVPYEQRYELMMDAIKKIDPTLEAVFIPRTLYELFLIRKCIEEDLENKSVCRFVSPREHAHTLESFGGDQSKYAAHLANNTAIRKQRNCWHLCSFSDAGNDNHSGVKEIAYRLNKVIVDTLAPPEEGFTEQELTSFTDREISFLKSHYQHGIEVMKKRARGENVVEVSNCSSPGPTTNFGFESTRGAICPMGIRHEADAKIIRDAVALECSKVAKRLPFIL
jgi:hypothetical protein